MSLSTGNTFAAVDENSTHALEAEPALRLQCVICSRILVKSGGLDSEWVCPQCGFELSTVKGIFRCLAPGRELHFEQFVREYELVRSKEGRGSAASDYYLALPFNDLSGYNTWQWGIRARTWRHLEKHLLRDIERSYPNGCNVLDIGAGNCWLSYRLALRGHHPVAADLLANDTDGLGAAKHYFNHLSRPFPRFQAEMDRLPFASEQFDVAVFNASFHYSVDYEATLREALRCLRRPGHIIIVDSPFYRRDESGRVMVQEKRDSFERQFGFRSDSIPSREYLTQAILDELAAKFSVQWKLQRPWYGWNWAFRFVLSRLLRRREPSKFFVIWTGVQK